MDIRYFCGLFDGEGSFSIQVNIRKQNRSSIHFNPRITMTLKKGHGNTILIMDDLQKTFGGKIYYTDKKSELRWHVGKREELINLTNKMIPYLIIKKDIAKRFLEALILFPKTRKDHLKGKRSWNLIKTKKVARIALTLNPSKKSPKTLKYIQKVIGIYI